MELRLGASGALWGKADLMQAPHAVRSIGGVAPRSSRLRRVNKTVHALSNPRELTPRCRVVAGLCSATRRLHRLQLFGVLSRGYWCGVAPAEPLARTWLTVAALDLPGTRPLPRRHLT